MIIRLSGVVNDSIVDGPGIRFAIFTQGCPHHCPGCHNPQTHDPYGGYESDTGEVISQFEHNILLSGITLSGGDPFFQASPCAELAKAAHARGLSVWTYTGYTWETLMEDLAEHPDWKELLMFTDVLVDGPFVEGLRTLDCPWRGSSNQRLIDVPATFTKGALVEFPTVEQ